MSVSELTCAFEALSGNGIPEEGIYTAGSIHVPPYTKVTITGGTLALSEEPAEGVYSAAYPRQDTLDMTHLLFNIQNSRIIDGVCGNNIAYRIADNTITFSKGELVADPVWHESCGTFFKEKPIITSVDFDDEVHITDASNMFKDFRFVQNMDLTNLNLSQATSLKDMFYGCTSLVSLDVSGWDTSRITDMGGMFFDCTSLQSLDLSSWNTSNVTSMAMMFGYGENPLYERQSS